MMLGIESILHMLVDFLCAYSVLSMARSGAGVVIVYNIVAFGTQIIFGFLMDRSYSKYLGALGVFITLIASVEPEGSNFGYLFAVLLGLGNSLFHVGAGMDVIRSAKGRMRNLGIFVSFGTIGVMMGRHVVSTLSVSQSITTLFIAVVLVTLYCGLIMDRGCSEFDVLEGNLDKRWVFLMIFLAVVARSLTGWITPELTVAWFVTPIAVFLGKFSGGFLGDKFGARRVSVWALFTGVACSVLGLVVPFPIELIGVFACNMLMPLTLGMILSIDSKSPGFLFGVTTLALLVGSLPMFFIGSLSSNILSLMVYILTLVFILFTE